MTTPGDGDNNVVTVDSAADVATVAADNTNKDAALLIAALTQLLSKTTTIESDLASLTRFEATADEINRALIRCLAAADETDRALTRCESAADDMGAMLDATLRMMVASDMRRKYGTMMERDDPDRFGAYVDDEVRRRQSRRSTSY